MSLSPHRLVEFLTALSRCHTSDDALQSAAELVAEEFDAEVGVVVVGHVVRATVGFGQAVVPNILLADVAAGAGTITIDGLGRCETLAAGWKTGTGGTLLVVRRSAFGSEDRNLLLGMAGALGMALDMIGALERERGRQRVLEVLLEIQRSISHRAPLAAILTAVTDGARSLLDGCLVALNLDDPFDAAHPIVVGDDLTSSTATFSALVHIQGAPAGALMAAGHDGAPIARVWQSLLSVFAEHASLALTDARTVEAMQEAFRDPLTGLPNRQLFLDRLTRALVEHRTTHERVSVLFIDLDRFKNVNDTLGHAAGDALLRSVAERIRRCTRSDATAARFGGDEFAVFFRSGGTRIGTSRTDGPLSGSRRSGDDDATSAVEVAERIIATLHEPFSIDGTVVLIGATIGIAHADAQDPAISADDLLGNADLAMYDAKARGGGRALTYQPQLRAALMTQLCLQAELHGALGRGELTVHYQSIVDLSTGAVSGFEALLRWQHPERGWIAPSEFIPIAEATGAIEDIGRWVLGEACQQLASWRQIDPRLIMNVNVSAHQMRDPLFPVKVAVALQKTRLPGDALVLEVTESVLIDDDEDAMACLATLRSLGIAIALDDFGTGYSSLSYLQRLPVDILKIDRSFISGAARAGDDRLVRTILDLGRAYDLEVVGEGIETDEQRIRLRELGCSMGQGYLFARPAAPDTITIASPPGAGEAFVLGPLSPPRAAQGRLPVGLTSR